MWDYVFPSPCVWFGLLRLAEISVGCPSWTVCGICSKNSKCSCYMNILCSRVLHTEQYGICTYLWGSCVGCVRSQRLGKNNLGLVWGSGLGEMSSVGVVLGYCIECYFRSNSVFIIDLVVLEFLFKCGIFPLYSSSYFCGEV
jgi:hypothetical protein